MTNLKKNICLTVYKIVIKKSPNQLFLLGNTSTKERKQCLSSDLLGSLNS